MTKAAFKRLVRETMAAKAGLASTELAGIFGLARELTEDEKQICAREYVKLCKFLDTDAYIYTETDT